VPWKWYQNILLLLCFCHPVIGQRPASPTESWKEFTSNGQNGTESHTQEPGGLVKRPNSPCRLWIGNLGCTRDKPLYTGNIRPHFLLVPNQRIRNVLWRARDLASEDVRSHNGRTCTLDGVLAGVNRQRALGQKQLTTPEMGLGQKAASPSSATRPLTHCSILTCAICCV
jgi:hypothetical protein